MIKRHAGTRRLGAVLSMLGALALAGCDPQEAGYVQVQLGSGRPQHPPSLYLDGTRLDFSRGPTVVLRFRTGQVALKTSDSVWREPICRIVVRRNRISVVSVTATEAALRCSCQIPAPESTRTEPVCA